MTIVRRSIYTRCVLVALLLTLSAALAHGQQMRSAFVAGGKTAETPSDPSTEEAHLRRLIETLEDPARRDELLASLRALLAAQEDPGIAEDAAPENAFTAAADVVADGTEAVRDVALRIVDALERLALFVAWLESEWRDPSRRALVDRDRGQLPRGVWVGHRRTFPHPEGARPDPGQAGDRRDAGSAGARAPSAAPPGRRSPAIARRRPRGTSHACIPPARSPRPNRW